MTHVTASSTRTRNAVPSISELLVEMHVIAKRQSVQAFHVVANKKESGRGSARKWQISLLFSYILHTFFL